MAASGIKKTSAAISKEIGAEWRAMSKEEQREYTKDCIQQLEERREADAVAPHSILLAAFHDTRATVASIKKQVCLRLTGFMKSADIDTSYLIYNPVLVWNPY